MDGLSPPSANDRASWRTRVIPGSDQEQRGGVRADAVEGEQAGGTGSDEGDDQLVQALELAIEEPGAPAQFAHRDPGGVADDVAGRGGAAASPAQQSGPPEHAGRTGPAGHQGRSRSERGPG